MKKNKMTTLKFFTAGKIILAIVHLIITSAFIFFYTTKLTPINKYVIPIMSVMFFIFAVTWAAIILKYFSKTTFKNFAVPVIMILSAILLLIAWPNLMFFSATGNEVISMSTSPSGKNTVVVLSSGFIDELYTAYPVKFQFFYQHQNNGFVSKHDDWGGADIKVSWLSDNEAHVQIYSSFEVPNNGSNQDDVIKVRFN